MTVSTNIPNVTNLLQTAKQEGTLTSAAYQALQVHDIGAQIQSALGTQADDVSASEVILVTMMIDDSGSIRFVRGNTEAVRNGHNAVLDALGKSKQQDGILVHTCYLNGFVLFPYLPLSQAVRLDKKNYDPCEGTPLYDQTVVMLGTVLAKAQEFAENGVPVRTVSLIVTDGNDQHSRKATPSKVRSIVECMLKSERHIVAAMGVDDQQLDFRLIFRSMGIADQWILTPKNTPSEIRKAFEVFSQSAVRASQNAQQFGQMSLGGFGTP